MRTVYALYDPRNPDVMRYVGVAVDPEARLKTHLYDGRLYGRPCYTGKREEWINSLLRDQVTPGLKLLEKVEETLAAVREKYWIATLRASGHPLVNRSAGGQVRRLGPNYINPDGMYGWMLRVGKGAPPAGYRYIDAVDWRTGAPTRMLMPLGQSRKRRAK